jgi:hypothetical protein
VVEAGVYAVDVGKPSVPTRPLPITDPSLSEANHPATIGIDAVAEVEVLYLYLMLARYDGNNDVLVLTDRGKGGIVLDPAQHVGYTALDHRVTSDGPGLGVLARRRGHLFVTPISSQILLDLSTKSR